MDVSSLRVEIKAWERDFRAEHGRDPSIQEIKDQPAIAAKYKQYKSLKSAAALPKQPLPPSPSRSSLLPKSRPVKVNPPAVTANPFSPKSKSKSKSKPKRDNVDRTTPFPTLTPTNPFLTPTKPKVKSTSRRSPSLESDLFPPIHRPVFSTTTASQSRAAPSDLTERAATRARKRLRGEPVSPSPIKEKRIRTATFSGHSLRFPPLDDGSDSDGARRTRDDDVVIEATPVKRPPGGKQFHMLFEEPPASDASKSTTPKLKPTRMPGVLSTAKKSSGRTSSPVSEEEDWSVGINDRTKVKALVVSAASQPKRSSTTNGKLAAPRAPRPSKNDLHAAGPSQPTKGSAAQATPSSSRKRPLSSGARAITPELDVEGPGPSQTSAPRNSFLHLPLLPPSPPPSAGNDSSAKQAGKSKGKAKTSFSRKKARLLEEMAGGQDGDSTGDESLEEDLQVKIVEHRWYRTSSRPDVPETEAEGAGSEPELGWWPRADPLETAGLEPEQTETTTVSLPDELRRVLALSDTEERERERERQEALMVRGLLYGRGGAELRGAKVWGVGEGEDEDNRVKDDDALEAGVGAGSKVDDEEDWEGEPVPWEVGEL
ncbi:hypothetical protein CERSUDRAFT_110503 [Gelatoporia subvermispora B]|uniref:DNA replication regulator SLD2 n=1 Tax=Ceriporiopsis subvermispora (strain B) TaxID=914234 RepID=M2PYI8_CERS8|nr:hypothetical protein CERSUDRAFT_110503 [Gelatoporia subvermispora B]